MKKPGKHDEPEYIEAYRADPHNKYGGGKGIETQAKKFPMKYLRNYLKAYAVGKNYGSPVIDPRDLFALAMKEGRFDFGTNKYDVNNKRSANIFQKTYQHLIHEGLEPEEAAEVARFPAAINDHVERAKRLGISFGHSWTGLGTAVTGVTGKQAGDMMAEQRAAYSNPANRAFVDFIHKYAGYAPVQRHAEQPPAPTGEQMAQNNQQIEQTLSGLSKQT